MRLLLIRPPASSKMGNTETFTPAASAKARSVLVSPSRPRPNRKLAPTAIWRALRQPTSTCSTNSAALSCASWRLKGTKTSCWIPKRLEELELFFWEIEAQAWLTMKHLAWMRPEAHHRGNGMEVIRFSYGRDDTPMTRMEAVEAAQRQGGGGFGLLWRAERNQRRCARICG